MPSFMSRTNCVTPVLNAPKQSADSTSMPPAACMCSRHRRLKAQ
jgi:hypothetical protein